MKSFRQYLEEVWRKLESSDSQGGDRHVLYSTHEIGQHRVRVLFSHNGGKNYNADFSVGRKNAPGQQQFHGHGETMGAGSDAHAILHHVHKTIDRFIRHRKPSAINMATTETKKHDLYKRFGRVMMKKHGGFVHSRDHEQGGITMMHFPRNNKKS